MADQEEIRLRIRGCMEKYKNKQGTMEILEREANVAPPITQSVWEAMEVEDPEYFRQYTLRLAMIDQIVTLLQQEVAMVLHPTNVNVSHQQPPHGGNASHQQPPVHQDSGNASHQQPPEHLNSGNASHQQQPPVHVDRGNASHQQPPVHVDSGNASHQQPPMHPDSENASHQQPPMHAVSGNVFDQQPLLDMLSGDASHQHTLGGEASHVHLQPLPGHALIGNASREQGPASSHPVIGQFVSSPSGAKRSREVKDEHVGGDIRWKFRIRRFHNRLERQLPSAEPAWSGTASNSEGVEDGNDCDPVEVSNLNEVDNFPSSRFPSTFPVHDEADQDNVSSGRFSSSSPAQGQLDDDASSSIFPAEENVSSSKEQPDE